MSDNIKVRDDTWTDGDPELIERLRRGLRSAPRLCGLIAVLVSTATLLGWWLQIFYLTSIFPGWPAMVANSALMIAFAGASLILLAPSRPPRWRSAAGRICATIAGLIGGLTLAEYVLDIDLRIDQLLVTTGEAETERYPGRPSPQSATAVLFASIALLTLDLRTPRGLRPAEVLAFAAGIIPLLALLAISSGSRSCTVLLHSSRTREWASTRRRRCSS